MTTASEMDERSILSVLLSQENFIHAFSGALGSTIALTIFYPLDVVRTYQQVVTEQNGSSSACPTTPHNNRSSSASVKLVTVQNTSWIQIIQDIIAKRGFGALYSGIGAVNKSLCVSNFVYFYTYHAFKNLAVNKGFEMKPLLNLSLGMFAGVVNVLMTTPLWVANTRIKLQGTSLDKSSDDDGVSYKQFYKGLLDCMVKIAKQEGVGALWSGTVPSLVLVFNPAIHWAVYETLKSNLVPGSGSKSALYLFLISAIAKCIASVTTYPLQLLQNRLRAKWGGKQTEKELQTSMFVYFANIVKSQGFKGLFRGLEAKLWQTVLTAAFMFVIYEKLNANLLKLLLNKG